MTTQAPSIVYASDVHPDYAELVQKIIDETHALVADVETLDATRWMSHADKLDTLAYQLENLLIPTPTKASTTTSKSQKT